MSEVPLVLFIDLKPETRVDLRTAAKAAIAWADMVEEIGRQIDPFSQTVLELERSDPGSQKLRAVVKSLVGDPKTAIRTAIISSIMFVFQTAATWGVEQVLEWLNSEDAPQEVHSMTDGDLRKFAEEIVVALENRNAEKDAKRVYDELLHDENVTGAAMTSSDSGRPSIITPRSDFPPEVFVVEEPGLQKRQKSEQVELVLLRPILTSETNKRWGFSWPHGKIGATIKDHGFLERMADGQLNVQMAQGIVFTVILETVEENKNGVWTVREYNIEKVLHIEPPSRQSGLDLE